MTGPFDPADHESFDDEIAELALGLLDGRRRAELLDHVESCPRCVAQVERLSVAADHVVHVAAEIEPPVGFEQRVFECLGDDPQLADDTRAPTPIGAARRASRWGPRGRVGAVIAAAAAVVAIALGAGWALRGSGSPTHSTSITIGAPTREAALVTGKDVRGEVYLSSGSVSHPGWLTMSVHALGTSGQVNCWITTDDGTSYLLGSFTLDNGSGWWDAQLPVAADKVERARLVDASGHVLATASIPV